ncbi:MAG: hypothetical protein KZQ72_03955, partial [Candidatus Thiodiazotropha sp. (ex Cardiolucina cf. quadrata)]|nr:hypothetical protein [Candidatus Thiodiazotropha sp. (ex Cardiolucina cf. quadrata)]
YSDDVLRERNNSELIEIDGTSSIVLRILDHQEASILPLDEVKDQIIETLQKQKGEQQAAAEAEKRLAEIGSGSPLTQVAGSYAVMGPLTVGRNDTKLPMGLSSVLFRTEKPAVNGFSSGSARLASGDIAVYVLTGVKEGSVEEASSQQQTESLRRMRGRDYYEMVLADLESRADVEILLKSDSE